MNKRVLIISLVSIGCGTSGPEEGLYSLYSEVLNDGCGYYNDVDGGDLDEVEVGLSADGETVQLGGLECPREGDSFICIIENSEPEMVADKDANLFFPYRLEGGWTTPTHAEGVSVLELTCSGADCDDLTADDMNYSGVGCTTEMSFTMDLIE